MSLLDREQLTCVAANSPRHLLFYFAIDFTKSNPTGTRPPPQSSDNRTTPLLYSYMERTGFPQFIGATDFSKIQKRKHLKNKQIMIYCILYWFNFIIVGKLQFPNFQKITHEWDFKKVNPGGTVANNTKTTGPMLERSLQHRYPIITVLEIFRPRVPTVQTLL